MEFNVEVKMINLMEGLKKVHPYLASITYNRLNLSKIQILDYEVLDKYIKIKYKELENDGYKTINLSIDSINKFGISKIPGAIRPTVPIGIFLNEELANSEYKKSSEEFKSLPYCK